MAVSFRPDSGGVLRPAGCTQGGGFRKTVLEWMSMGT